MVIIHDLSFLLKYFEALWKSKISILLSKLWAESLSGWADAHNVANGIH